MPGSLCHRYGPGRLPYTDRRDVAGGVAMAATAALATLVWFALLSVVQSLLPDAAPAALDRQATLLAAVLLIVVPSALAAGTLLWRYLLPSRPHPLTGAVAGVLTSLAALIPVPLLITLAFAGASVAEGTPPVELLETTAVVGFMSLLFAYAFTVWIVVPVGAFGGWYHERAHADQSVARN